MMLVGALVTRLMSAEFFGQLCRRALVTKHRPYGTAQFYRPCFPTLKRGASKRCAYGAKGLKAHAHRAARYGPAEAVAL